MKKETHGNSRIQEVDDDKIINYVSKSAKIGNNVKIWHFAYVGKDAEISDNVMTIRLRLVKTPE
jgi:acyl-[acyl carrier protein]--UDP-N-acetylglucosamine O-acyltransferase